MKKIHLQLRNLIGQIESAMIQVGLFSPCKGWHSVYPMLRMCSKGSSDWLWCQFAYYYFGHKFIPPVQVRISMPLATLAPSSHGRVT